MPFPSDRIAFFPCISAVVRCTRTESDIRTHTVSTRPYRLYLRASGSVRALTTFLHFTAVTERASPTESASSDRIASLHNRHTRAGRVMLWDANLCRYEEHSLQPVHKAGKGAFGQIIVAKASGSAMHKKVVVKIPASQGMPAQLLTTEGNILSNIHHDNVVTVHGYIEHSCPNLFAALVLEACDGSLEGLLEPSHVKLSYQQRYLTMDQCFSALAAVHQAGVVHGDIKPGNILICKRGKGKLFDVKLADFGGSFMVGQCVGAGHGTPAYMSPECRDPSWAPLADVRSDVFSIGCMMVELVSNRQISEVFPTLQGLADAHFRGTFVQKMTNHGRIECEPEWLQVASWCMAYCIHQRPFAAQVLAYLRHHTPGGISCMTSLQQAMASAQESHVPQVSTCSAAAPQFVPRKLSIKRQQHSVTPDAPENIDSTDEVETPTLGGGKPFIALQPQIPAPTLELVMKSTSTSAASSPRCTGYGSGTVKNVDQ